MNRTVNDMAVNDGLGALIALYSYVRAFVGGLLAVIHTIVFSLVVIGCGVLGAKEGVNWGMHVWAVGLLKIFGIRLEVEGAENLPESGGGIIVFNHQSHFDIPALSAVSRKTVRYGAKIELFKVPIFGPAIRASGSLPIARHNRTEVLRVYREAEARFAENFLFCLAPEGTRQAEPKIGRFKKGPFVFAVSGQAPVIPAVVSGAYDVLPKGRLAINVGRLSRTIRVRLLPAVSTKGLGPEDVDALCERVRTQMERAFEVAVARAETEDQGITGRAT